LARHLGHTYISFFFESAKFIEAPTLARRKGEQREYKWEQTPTRPREHSPQRPKQEKDKDLNANTPKV
jgi:hypothetical protein